MASTRPLRTTRQSSRESAGGGFTTRSASRGEDDAVSTGSGSRRLNSYGRAYGSLTGAAAQQSQLGAKKGGGGGSGDMPYITAASSNSGGGAGGAAPKKVNIPGFLTKTYEIFSSGEYDDLCGWGAGGDTIIIKKVPEFSATVLPRYFKHSNFQSFVRQLNMYDFHKTVQDPSHGEFRHQYFKRGRPDLLHMIKRKVSQPSGTGGGAGGGSGGGAAHSTAARLPQAQAQAQDVKPLPAPPSAPALTAAAAMMAMPGSGSTRSLDVDGVEGAGAGAGGGGGGAKMSKSWQKRTETRLQECEELVRRLGTENQLLWTQLHSTQAAAKALKRTQLRLVGIVQDLLAAKDGGAAPPAEGAASASASASTAVGAGPALQKLKAELETLTMSPAAAVLDAGGMEQGGVSADVLSALPPSMAMAAGAGMGEEGAQIVRGMSLSDPLGFWRNFSRTASFGSMPSFGPGAVHSLQDPATAGAGAAGETGAEANPAAVAGGAGGGLVSPATTNPPEWFGRQMSLQRLGSGGGGPSRKRTRMMQQLETVQGISKEVGALHELSQGLVGRVDSMEQTLSTLMGLDPDAAFPESLEDTATAGFGAGGGADAGAAEVGKEGEGGLKDNGSAAPVAEAAAPLPPPSALEGAPLVKQQAVSMSGPVVQPVSQSEPVEGGTAGID